MYTKKHLATIKKQRAGLSLVGLLTTIAVIGGGTFATWHFMLKDMMTEAAIEKPITSKVTRGEFRYEIVNKGTIESSSNLEVRCQVEGGSQILTVEEEGKYVNKGDIIITFDDSTLRDRELQQQLKTSQAEALKKKAKLLLESAELSIEEYKNGTFVEAKQAAEAQIEVAKEDYERAQEYVSYSEKLFAKGYVTPLQLKADHFAVKNAELKLQAAKTKLYSLINYTYQKQVNKLESDKDSIAAEKLSIDASYELELKELKEIEEQIENCVVTAPGNGQVVYHRDRGERSGTPIIIESGTNVKERQLILKLPDPKQMEVSLQIHESKINSIKEKFPSKISIDAIPGLILEGEVKEVATIPSHGSWQRGYVKEYRVVVGISDPPENLKPGMSSEIAIEIEVLPDVLQVPIQAVVKERGEFSGTYCVQFDGKELVRRDVVLGSSNDKFVVIEDGLLEGDEVVMNPRAYERFLNQTKNYTPKSDKPAVEGETAPDYKQSSDSKRLTKRNGNQSSNKQENS